MAHLEEPTLVAPEPLGQSVIDTRRLLKQALGHEISDDEAMQLGYDLLEFFGALTGPDDGVRKSC